jgi:hypothetical protein
MPEIDLFPAFPTSTQETPANSTQTQAPLSDMDDFAQTREADDLFESEIQPSAPLAPPPSAPKEPRAFANRGRGVYHVSSLAPHILVALTGRPVSSEPQRTWTDGG